MATQVILDTLKDAILGNNPIPAVPAEKCLSFMARSFPNHELYINAGFVEFFVSQLSILWESPRSEVYLNAISNMAFQHKSVQERCGKEGVFVALRMLRKLSSVAAELLAMLMNVEANREIMRTSNGVEIVLAYTKKTCMTTGLLILCSLAEEDTTVITKVVSELADLLADIIKSVEKQNEKVLIIHWIQV
jgi:hypothetical protein